MISKFWYVSLFFIVTLSCGFLRDSENGGRASPIHVRLENEGTEEIADAYATFGEWSTIRGGLVGNGSVNHLFFNHPVGSSATVHFSYLDGSQESAEVEFPSPLPSAEITLVFIIESDSRTVRVELRED